MFERYIAERGLVEEVGKNWALGLCACLHIRVHLPKMCLHIIQQMMTQHPTKNIFYRLASSKNHSMCSEVCIASSSSLVSMWLS